MPAIDACAMMGLLLGVHYVKDFTNVPIAKNLRSGFGWLTWGFSVALPYAFHCFSLGLWAAFSHLSGLIIMRFCPALVFHMFFHIFPVWLLCASLPMRTHIKWF